MQDTLTWRMRLQAIAAVLGLFVLIFLYVREFAVLSNTLGVRGLVVGSIVVGLALGAAAWYRLRVRLSPAERHLPEILTLLILPPLFMPLFASLLNRAAGPVEYERFKFVSETPYIASKYGILRGEKLKPTGYYLTVERDGRQYRVQYETQAFYPITEEGQAVLLPVKKGLLGFRVVWLR